MKSCVLTLGLAFGGYQYTTSTSAGDRLSLTTAYMFDPVSKQWHQQLVSGDAPQSTINPCVAGLEGDSGTYEIFLYGGVNADSTEQTIDLGAVYVLSLPAFHWEKQSNPLPYGRWLHSCEIIGNRQMVRYWIGSVASYCRAGDRTQNLQTLLTMY